MGKTLTTVRRLISCWMDRSMGLAHLGHDELGGAVAVRLGAPRRRVFLAESTIYATGNQGNFGLGERTGNTEHPAALVGADGSPATLSDFLSALYLAAAGCARPAMVRPNASPPPALIYISATAHDSAAGRSRALKRRLDRRSWEPRQTPGCRSSPPRSLIVAGAQESKRVHVSINRLSWSFRHVCLEGDGSPRPGYPREAFTLHDGSAYDARIHGLMVSQQLLSLHPRRRGR